jgi:hypothetical protein
MARAVPKTLNTPEYRDFFQKTGSGTVPAEKADGSVLLPEEEHRGPMSIAFPSHRRAFSPIQTKERCNHGSNGRTGLRILHAHRLAAG